MPREAVPPSIDGVRVIFATQAWEISGVNSFTHNLIRGLVRRGVKAELLVIRATPPQSNDVPLPDDIPVSHLTWSTAENWWRSRWQALITYLTAESPCIYIPNFDFENSGIVSALPDSVAAIGITHSDDPLHYEHAIRLGRYWNAAVSVSRMLHESVVAQVPDLADRSRCITYGVPHPPALAERAVTSGAPLSILYSGRFYEPQKRVSDLPRIAHRLHAVGVPFRLDLIGSGSEEAALRRDFAGLLATGHVRFLGPMPHDALRRHYAEADCLILTSNFEGMPLSLLEAMAQGCIPVVTDVRSGIPEIVRNDSNGYRVPIGDIEAFAARFGQLHGDLDVRARLRRGAFQTIATEGYSIDTAVERYIDLFQWVRRAMEEGAWQRPPTHRSVEFGATTGDIIPPPSLQICPDQHFSLKWRYDRAMERIAQLEGQPAPTVAAASPVRGLRHILRVAKRLLGEPT